MMKSTIRSLGIGFFLAGSIMAINNQFNPEKTTASITSSKSSATDQKGTVVIKKAELNTLKEEAADAKEQLAKIQTDYQNLKKEQSSKSNEKNKVTSYKLAIKKGMGTTEVSEALKEGGIIKNAAEFERYIINEDKAKYIQIGDYPLTSDMSNEEILKIITSGK
ncbi:endolytic transglycosylase MltG [Rummeliibacillus suwonensis]|uniref:endolytic transglycosylase MltG n=1 Tax=Rummeliibacillus suwonensis TaxID=1306154 RepID=UPI001AAEF809|nr:endolytic transglycosylase MltG [Rummeliibacillus suwonensis]MBO2534992.1 endolytic transglycosylase MltG [Rummeliibacillus suwonensis]